MIIIHSSTCKPFIYFTKIISDNITVYRYKERLIKHCRSINIKYTQSHLSNSRIESHTRRYIGLGKEMYFQRFEIVYIHTRYTHKVSYTHTTSGKFFTRDSKNNNNKKKKKLRTDGVLFEERNTKTECSTEIIETTSAGTCRRGAITGRDRSFVVSYKTT